MSSATRKLVRLDPARANEAAHTLTRAFMNDPLQVYTFPDPVQRAELSVPHFEAVVRYGLLAGHVWVTPGEIQAVGVWWSPEHTAIRQDLLEVTGFARLPEVIGVDAFARYLGVIEAMERLHKRDQPTPDWYALVLGVDPSCQGRGLGKALLEAVFDLADAQQAPCYLETMQPDNVRFYTSNGFRRLAEGVEPVSRLRYWTFARTPRSAN